MTSLVREEGEKREGMDKALGIEDLDGGSLDSVKRDVCF